MAQVSGFNGGIGCKGGAERVATGKFAPPPAVPRCSNELIEVTNDSYYRTAQEMALVIAAAATIAFLGRCTAASGSSCVFCGDHISYDLSTLPTATHRLRGQAQNGTGGDYFATSPCGVADPSE